MLYLRNLIEPFAMKLDTPEHVARGIVQHGGIKFAGVLTARSKFVQDVDRDGG